MKTNISIELLKVYNILAEQINASARMAHTLHSIKDIKASGNEIEEAFRKVFNEIIPLRYRIAHGHIVDNLLSVSKQYDVVITENIDYGSIVQTKDTTELFFYETIYSIGEIKATWDFKNFNDTVNSIKDLRTRLYRKTISNKTILSGNAEVQLSSPVTQNAYRNPLFSFAFAIKEGTDINKIATELSAKENWVHCPNIIVILNFGIFILIDIKQWENQVLDIQLYPEFSIKENCEWRFLRSSQAGQNLAYLFACLLEHLTNTVLEKPPFLTYANSMFNIHEEDLIPLSDL